MFRIRVLRRFFATVATASTVFAMTACAPVKETHGYFAKAEHLLSIKAGSHTQREVEMLMGSPSTIGTFDTNTWYYIASISSSFAWRPPEVLSRHVIAIKFDEETKLISEINQYTIADGRVIAFADDVTPTRGRELSILEQLIGNVGRQSADQFIDDDRDQ